MGILDVEFPKDPYTRARFAAMVPTMPLDSNGFCEGCATILSLAIGRLAQ
jgi:hypothetical protein